MFVCASECGMGEGERGIGGAGAGGKIAGIGWGYLVFVCKEGKEG